MISVLFFLLVFIIIFYTLFLILCKNGGVSLTLHSVFQVFFFLIPGYVQYKMNIFPWEQGIAPKENEYNMIFLICYIYNFFFLVAYLITRLNKQDVLNSIAPSKLKSKHLLLNFLILIPAFLLVGYIGIEKFFHGRIVVSTIVYGSGNSMVVMLYTLVKFSCVSLLVYLMLIWRDKDKFFDGNKLALLTFVLITLMLNVLLNGPTSSPRFHFMAVIISILLVYRYFISWKSNITLLFGAPFFLFFVFPFIKQLGDKSQFGFDNFNLFEYVTEGVDFDAFQQMFNIVRYVDATGYSFGENFLGGVAFFVPRAIWTTKPEHLGYLSSLHAGYNYNNLSAPLFGEFYYMLGVIGVVVGGLFFGWLLKLIDKSIQLRMSMCSLGLSILFAAFLFITLRGAFGSVFPAVSVALFFYYLLCLLVRVKLNNKSP
jgi:oligosaccharide repeat unit polymerase